MCCVQLLLGLLTHALYMSRMPKFLFCVQMLLGLLTLLAQAWRASQWIRTATCPSFSLTRTRTWRLGQVEWKCGVYVWVCVLVCLCVCVCVCVCLCVCMYMCVCLCVTHREILLLPELQRDLARAPWVQRSYFGKRDSASLPRCTNHDVVIKLPYRLKATIQSKCLLVRLLAG